MTSPRASFRDEDLPGLVIADVGRRIGQRVLFEHLSLAIPHRRILVIAGPSGVGKTCLLRILAGLDLNHDGRILMDGADITNAPPQERGVSLLFQSPVLYEHLSVRENICFPHRIQGVSRSQSDAVALELATRFEVAHLLDRSPRNLSGGELQRAALARTFASNRTLRLLDEPLKAALEPDLRLRLRREIRLLHAERGGITVIVTHDQEEALELADDLLVMLPGFVSSRLAPRRAYALPPNMEVARFLGGGSVFAGGLSAGRHSLMVDHDSAVKIKGDYPTLSHEVEHWMLRPNAVRLDPGSDFVVRSSRFHGPRTRVTVESATGTLMEADMFDTDQVREGERVSASVDPRGLLGFDASGNLVRPDDGWQQIETDLRTAASLDAAFYYAKTSLGETLSDIGFSAEHIRDCQGVLEVLRAPSTGRSAFKEACDRFTKKWATDLQRVYTIGYESFRADFFSKHLADLLKDRGPTRVLDLGCGRGLVSAWLSEQLPNAEILGVDVVTYPRDWESVQARRPAVRLEQIAIDRFGRWLSEKRGFDLVVCLWVLHHSDQSSLETTLATLAGTQAPGLGLLILEDAFDGESAPASDPHGLWPRFQVLMEAAPDGPDSPSAVWGAQALLDFVAVRLLARYDTVDMPFQFREARQWCELLDRYGFATTARHFVGFPSGRDIAVPQFVSVHERR